MTPKQSHSPRVRVFNRSLSFQRSLLCPRQGAHPRVSHPPHLLCIAGSAQHLGVRAHSSSNNNSSNLDVLRVPLPTRFVVLCSRIRSKEDDENNKACLLVWTTAAYSDEVRSRGDGWMSLGSLSALVRIQLVS